MEKTLLFLFAMAFIYSAKAQDAKAIFTAEKIVFYGLDFTKAKFAIPDAKPSEIKADYFSAWNSTVFGDNGRFPKESAFAKVSVSGDPTIVEKRNATVIIGNMTDSYNASLSKGEIESVISEYKNGMRKEGLGVVFIVEYFSKKEKKGIADVVFFDIATRKVLLAKQLTGEPRGAGLNSYWMGTIQQMFEKITNTEYALWKKEVMGK
jgi:hypothetical protein